MFLGLSIKSYQLRIACTLVVLFVNISLVVSNSFNCRSTATMLYCNNTVTGCQVVLSSDHSSECSVSARCLCVLVEAIMNGILRVPDRSLDWGCIVAANVFSTQCIRVAVSKGRTELANDIITTMYECYSEISGDLDALGGWVSQIYIY